MMRIYVGGLGASVQEDDLRKTFGSPHLGTVDSVEIIRSKGRSFAYLDFVPASDKSLAKLFSAYNGCMWRGGRLKLEKAKEHFLSRLKREWTEDAELANVLASQNVEADEKKHALSKSKEDFNKAQLKIFFPKLRKITPVPLKGTGKHKYSFQRVEVPSLPINFCDCEEHSGPPVSSVKFPVSSAKFPVFSAKLNYANEPEVEIGGVTQEELSMMKSVLDRLFEKENLSKENENHSNKFSDDAECDKKINPSVTRVDELEVGENEDDYLSDDDDNLVINVVTKPSNRVASFEDRGQKSTTNNQNYLLGQPESFNSRPTYEVRGNQKNLLPNKKRKASFNANEPNKKSKASHDENAKGQNDTDNLVPTKISEKGPHARMPSKRKAKKEAPHDYMGDPTGSAQSVHGEPPSQKSEWRNLVGKKGSTAFLISDIFADSTVEHEAKSQAEHRAAPSELENDSQGQTLTEDRELENVSPVKSTEPSALEAKPAKGASWSQKASWLQLVGNKSNTTFSLANVLPGLASEKIELLQSDGKDFAHSKVENQHRFSFKRDTSAAGNMNEDCPQSSNVNASVKERDCGGADREKVKSDEKQRVEQEAFTALPGSSGPSNRTPVGEINISETCPFMKSAASMKEWTKMKTALSSSLKKKAKGKESVQD